MHVKVVYVRCDGAGLRRESVVYFLMLHTLLEDVPRQHELVEEAYANAPRARYKEFAHFDQGEKKIAVRLTLMTCLMRCTMTGAKSSMIVLVFLFITGFL